jgi:hypothetical protein
MKPDLSPSTHSAPQLLRPIHGQQAQQHGVGGAEERRAGADRDGQDQDRGEREGPCAQELPYREAQIGSQLVDEPQAERLAALLLVPVGRAELQPRAAKRLLAREALGRERVRARLQVEGHLVRHVGLDPVALQQAAQEPHQPAHAQACSGWAARAVATAVANAFQLSVSSRSWRRPDAVRR